MPEDLECTQFTFLLFVSSALSTPYVSYKEMNVRQLRKEWK